MGANNNNGFLGMLGNAAAGGIIGTGLGMLTSGWQDDRQYKQAKRLQKLEMQGNKQMFEYQRQLQMQMWQDTNYGAQVQQMKEAGLSPGLIYGGSGAGGATVGGGGASVTGQHAPVGGGEGVAGMGMMMELAMMKAQKDLLESQARKNNVEANKAEGVDTEKTKTEIEQILQTIKNQQAQEELTKAQAALTKFELSFEQDARKSRLEAIDWMSVQALEQLEALRIQNKISNETQQAASEAIIKQAAQVGIVNILLQEQAKTEQTKQTLNLAQAKQVAAKIVQDWTAIGVEQFKADTQLLQVQINEELKNMEIELNASEKIRGWVETITNLIPWKSKQTPVGFQRNSERKY